MTESASELAWACVGVSCLMDFGVFFLCLLTLRFSSRFFFLLFEGICEWISSQRSWPTYGLQHGSTFQTALWTQQMLVGSPGGRFNFMSKSLRNLSAFLELHGLQHATTLSHRCSPPLLRGMTWSTFSACAPQYWQMPKSRRRIVRRLGGGSLGRILTYRRRETTEGMVMLSPPHEIHWRSLGTTSEAFSFHSSARALQAETIAIGS
mmetsp:Transcript_9008/g.21364  ORF Transcript_9008/g.21364 Transcript_9008/m.21364 type:complete len:207 (-) Transcript_9008:803-1423(-)